MERPKIACKLTSPELQERKRVAIAELKSLLIDKSETRHGFKYRFEGSDKLVDLLADFITNHSVSFCHYCDTPLPASVRFDQEPRIGMAELERKSL
jgi:hypothetical protein